MTDGISCRRFLPVAGAPCFSLILPFTFSLPATATATATEACFLFGPANTHNHLVFKYLASTPGHGVGAPQQCPIGHEPTKNSYPFVINGYFNTGTIFSISLGMERKKNSL